MRLRQAAGTLVLVEAVPTPSSNWQGGLVVAVAGGTETFVFTDIEDSTGLLRASSDVLYHGIQTHAHELVRTSFAASGGREVGSAGDGLFFVFTSARAAVVAALDAQRRLALEVWPASCHVRVRIGMHTGEAVVDEGVYTGFDVNLANRVCAAARGGEVLLSHSTAVLADGNLPGGCALIDAGSHELRGVGPRRLHRLVHPDLPVIVEPSDPARTLPIEATTFIGREASIVDIQQALATSPVVTLLGPGGVGKTRLAARVARELGPSFADGVMFVDLTAAVDETATIGEIAAAVGAQEQPGVTLLDAVISRIRGRRMLLVLDNAEHVANQCGAVCDRLARATAVSLLVTSRVALRAASEVLVPVEPLVLPGEGRAPDESEAVRLFVDRARRVRRPFTLDQSNAMAVATICRQLDGLPLAIELAAARVRLLTAEQIADELATGISGIRDAGGDRPERHRSLEACVEWSFGLLSAKARVLVQRLSVFAGGFDLDAAVRVCGGHDIDREEVIDALLALVDASLLTVDASRGRLRMLDTIRRYAASAVAGDDDLRDRHLGWVLELARAIARDDEATALRRLDADHANVMAALEWALQRDRGDLALQILSALWLCFLDHGRGDRVVELTRAALALDDRRPSRDRLYALVGLALMTSATGDLSTAIAAIDEADEIATALDDATGLAWARNARGWIALTLHDPEASQYLEPVIEHARQTRDHRLLADALIAAGMTKALTGRTREGVADLEEAVAVAAEGGLTVGFRPAALTFLGAARLVAGDIVGALGALDESCKAMQARPHARHWFHTPFTLTLRNVTLTLLGRIDEARASLSRLLVEDGAVPHSLVRSIMDAGAGLVAQWSGDLDGARDAYTRSLVFTGDPFWAAWARHGLAQVALAEHDVSAAKAHLEALRRHLTGVGDAFHECRAENLAGQIARVEGDVGEAITRYSNALQRGIELPMSIVAIEALEGLAGAFTVRQDAELAARLLGAADAARAKAGLARASAQDADIDDVTAILVAAVGSAHVADLRAEGAALDPNEVLVLALAGRGRKRTRARAGWGSLTRAEQNVAALVAKGLSNPEISERLFISRRTVERHVANIFAKTGVASRARLAAEVARRTLDAGSI